MDFNTSLKRPDWLTDEEIADLRQELKECPNPYTDEEELALENDAPFDVARSNAHFAKKLLTKYGIPLTDEDATTE